MKIKAKRQTTSPKERKRPQTRKMPRGRRYDQSSATAFATQHAAARLLSKSSDFEKGITTLHKYNLTIAESLSHGGPIESSLTKQNSQHEQFLETQRERLKSLAEMNVRSMYAIQDMLGAVQSVSQEAASSEHQAKNDDNGEGEEKVAAAKDYKALIEMKIKQKAEERSKSRRHFKNEQFVRECLERLGETSEALGAGNNDDDDELEVVTQHDSSNDAGLKCPITSQIFKKPYRNKVCGHVYEYDAILSHLRMKSHCPVAGCVNSSVNLSQLEEDFDMKMKIHRCRKRQEQEDRLKMSQVEEKEYDDEDEDEGDDGNNGTTLIR